MAPTRDLLVNVGELLVAILLIGVVISINSIVSSIVTARAAHHLQIVRRPRFLPPLAIVVPQSRRTRTNLLILLLPSGR